MTRGEGAIARVAEGPSWPSDTVPYVAGGAIQVRIQPVPLMRVVSRFLALVLLASVAVSAQTGDPIPDPTPPHLYFPLTVGDVREYETCVESFGLICFRYEVTRREIVRDSLIGDARYFLERTWAPGAEDWTDLRETRLLRFDTTSALVVARSAEGAESPVTCRLDAAFNSVDDVCGLSVEERPTDRKFFGASDAGEIYEVGVGLVERYGGNHGSVLTYASVRQEDGSVLETGARYNVSTDEDAGSDPLAITALPNPTAGPLALALDVPTAATVTLGAFDALGRRVWTREVALAAGRQRVEVDAAGWAPGLYVVRARTEGASATATVVRR